MRAYRSQKQLHKDPFTLTAIVKLIKMFESRGSVHDSPRSGRPSLEEARSEVVMEELDSQKRNQPLGVASASSISRVIDIPRGSVNRIFKHHLGLYSYKLMCTQAITADNKIKRLEFAYFIKNHDQLETILWNDEANFSLDGTVNKHNAIIWGTERPRETQQIPLHSPHFIVWMGFSRDFKLKPYFFDGTKC